MGYVSIPCPLLAVSRHCNTRINLAEAGSPPSGKMGRQKRERLMVELLEKGVPPFS